LLEARLVLEVAGTNQIAFVPGRPPDKITCHDVLQSMRACGGQELETRHEPSRPIVSAEFQRIQEAECKVASAVTLEQLVNRIDSAGPENTLS
jgi:hypothetical protein